MAEMTNIDKVVDNILNALLDVSDNVEKLYRRIEYLERLHPLKGAQE